MNDLHYIFYEAKRMYLDTSDMCAFSERAHRRCCDFIWINDKPPLNKNKSLQQITHTDAADWGEVKRDLLGKGWLEINEYFLHRGVIKTLNESKVKYVESFNRQATMNKVEKLRLSSPDAVTGIVTIIVTLPVTPAVTTMQSESQPESESEKKNSLPQKQGLEKGSGEGLAAGHHAAVENGPPPEFREVPTVEEAIAMTMTAGIPEDFCRYVFDKWSVRAGRDGAGVIVPWLPHVTGRWKNESVEWNNGTHTGKRNDKNRHKPNPRNLGMSETAAEKSTDVATVLAARSAKT